MVKCDMILNWRRLAPCSTLEKELVNISFNMSRGKYGDCTKENFNLVGIIEDILRVTPAQYKNVSDTKPSGYSWVHGQKCKVNEMRFRYATLYFYLAV